MATQKTTAAFEKANEHEPFPPYSGEKIRIQVLQVGVSDAIVKKYPEFAEKRVGFGIANRLVETLYETNRFDYVEEKQEMISKIIDQWKLGESGIVAKDAAIAPGSLVSPKFLVYAEVYEFSVSYGEAIAAMASTKRNTTMIGIQVKFLDVVTGQYVPGSGSGQSASTATALWLQPDLPFDQSTVGMATQQAIDKAVRNVLRRLDKK
ncbi:MAG: CsgG/HfaB family protein [Bacteriovoracaceae bacterium]